MKWLAAFGLGLLAAGCAGAGGGPADDEDVRYRVDAFVLEDPSHGPELCVGGVADSLPPQCGGIPLVGWDWDAVEGEDEHGGARWGQFDVVGTYDGETFTVLEVGLARDEGPRADPIVWTSCPEPEGGWTSTDPVRTTEDDLVAAMRAAEREGDFSGFWVDDSAGVGGVHIVSAAFTGDLDRHEAELREVWGGPLCLVEHRYTDAELSRIQRELSDPEIAAELGIETTWSGTSARENQVEVGVVVATDEARAAIAQRYGEGAVNLFPALVPVQG